MAVIHRETSRCSRPRSFSDTLSNVRRWRGSHETLRARPRGVEWLIDGVAVQKCLPIKTWRVRNARTNGENEWPREAEMAGHSVAIAQPQARSRSPSRAWRTLL